MPAYKTLQFQITGVAPLIHHNGQTADPLNQHSINIAAIAGKRKKVEADHRELSKREFFASLYVDKDQEPIIPLQIIEASLIEGAKKQRRGPAAKAGLLVNSHSRLEYDGPRKPDALWADARFHFRVAVRVNMSRVMRTRPWFDRWSASVAVDYLPSMLNPADVRSFLVTAGEQIGIGDWRPRFGRFSVGEE